MATGTEKRFADQILEAESLSLGPAGSKVALTGTELGFTDGVTAGTAAPSKALVLNSSGNIDAFGVGALTGADSSLDITGQAAAQGGDVVATGGTSSTAGNAGGVAKIVGGTPGATSAGGAAQVTGGIGGATSGTGGAATVAGGAGTAGNSAGGIASITGGAGQGSAAGGIGKTVGGLGGATGAGGKAQLVGGAGGATSGAGGFAEVTGGAGTAGNGNGGDVVLAAGAKNGSGKDGAIIARGTVLRTQAVPAAKTVTAAISAAELVAGLVTTTGVTGPSEHQLPTGTLIDAELPGIATGDSFDFYLINTGTGAAEDATITVNTDVTIVGNPTVGSLTDATIIVGSGHFRARRSAANTYVVYRLA